MERVPNIDIGRKRSLKAKLLFIFLYATLFVLLIIAAEYIFIKKDLLSNLNPVSQMQNYYKDKKYSKVLEKGTTLLEKYPRSIIIRRYLWKSYLYTNQFSKALRTIKAMETLSPNPIEIYLAYCTTFRFMGEYEKVYYYCGKALEIKASNQMAHEQIVQALVEQKKYDEAVAYLDKMIKQQPDDIKNMILKANIATLRKDYKESIQILEQARKKNPESAIIYYYLADNYFNLNEYIDAAGFYEEFVDSVYKKDVDVELLENAYTNLALSYERAGMYSNAFRAYKSAACLTTKLKKNTQTITLLSKAIASTYSGYSGFVSQTDFQKKFKKLEQDIESKCGGKLFEDEQAVNEGE